MATNVTIDTTLVLKEAQILTVTGAGTVAVMKGIPGVDGTNVPVAASVTQLGPIGKAGAVVTLRPKNSLAYTISYSSGSLQTDDYTLQLGDAGGVVEMSKATAQVLTVPPDSSVNFPLNTEITVVQTGAGGVTVTEGSGVTFISPGAFAAKGKYVPFKLRKIRPNTWLVTDTKTTSLVLPGTPMAVYSVVKRPSWNGYCFRVKRSSDNGLLDVGFTENGVADFGAAFDFVGASTATIETWYDQSGNGYDATAATGQPTIKAGNDINGIQPLTFCSSNSTGNIKLTTAAGVSVSTQAFTVCMAYSAGGGWLNFNALLGIGTQINLWWEKFVGVIQGSSLFTSGDKKLFSPRQGQVDSVILSGSATQRILRNNGNEQVVASAYTLATASPGYIGANTVVGVESNDIFAYVVYASELVTSDKIAVEAAFKTAFRTKTNQTTKLVTDGDSITANFTTDAYLYGYPRVITTALGNNISLYNIAVPGQTMATCYTNRSNVTNRYDAGVSKNLNLIFAGTNDLDNRASGTIVGYGTTVFNTYTLPYIQAMQAQGFNKVFVGTAIARNWAGSAQDKLDKEAERLVYNQLIRANASLYGYVVLDFASLPEMSNYANTNYIVDAVHPSRNGYAVMGAYAAPLIEPYI